MRVQTKAQIFRALASRHCGVSADEAAEAMGIDRRRAQTVASNEIAGKNVTAAHVAGHPKRWFTSPADAEAHRLAITSRYTVHKPKRLRESKRVTPDAGVTYHERFKGVTVIPTPVECAKYQALQLPADPRYPSFSGRIGQYDKAA